MSIKRYSINNQARNASICAYRPKAASKTVSAVVLHAGRKGDVNVEEVLDRYDSRTTRQGDYTVHARRTELQCIRSGDCGIRVVEYGSEMRECRVSELDIHCNVHSHEVRASGSRSHIGIRLTVLRLSSH
jgi:hypothetical protein